MIKRETNQSLPNDSLIPLIFGEIHNIIHKINSIHIASPLVVLLFFVTTRFAVLVLLSDLGLLCSYYSYFSLVETWSLVALLILFIFLASFLLLY